MTQRSLGSLSGPIAIALLLAAAAAPARAQAPAAADTPSAATILERYVAAIGGREALGRITTEERLIRDDDGATLLLRRDLARNRRYSRQEDRDGVSEDGSDGQRAWQRSPSFRGWMDPTDPMAQAMTRKTYPLWQYREAGRSFTRLPDETVDGRRYLVVEGEEPGFRGPVKFHYYFDPATFLLKRQAIGGGLGTVLDFDDYREQDGIREPFTTVEHQPFGTRTRRVQWIRRNVAIPDSVFEYRDAPSAAGPSGDESAAPSTTTAAAGADSMLPETVREQTVELVWRTIAESHWDTTFGGVDWRAVRDRYRVRARSTPGAGAFHRLLTAMVGELRQTHFRVSPPPPDTRAEAEVGVVGARLLWSGEGLLVESVEPGSAAARAGVRRGMVVRRIDGRTPDELLAARDRSMGPSPLRPALRRVRAASAALVGRSGTAVTLETEAAGRRETLRVVRQAPPPLTSFDQMAGFETRRLAGGVAYVRFGMFYGTAGERFRQAMDTLRTAPGLVLDLRGNPGGIKAMMQEMAGLLFERDGTLGRTRMRYQTQEIAFRGAGERAYRGPLAILVDARSGSCSEILAGALQALGRAVVVGDTSAGAVLPSQETPLPSGGTLQHAVGDYRTPSGVVLEGRGVAPDVLARPTSRALLAGRDPALDAALAALRARPGRR